MNANATEAVTAEEITQVLKHVVDPAEWDRGEFLFVVVTHTKHEQEPVVFSDAARAAGFATESAKELNEYRPGCITKGRDVDTWGVYLQVHREGEGVLVEYPLYGDLRGR